MNINVQQQNFEKINSPIAGRENIEDVNNKADDNIKKLEKNPEKKSWIVNRIKGKLWLDNDDSNKKTTEATKTNKEAEESIVNNQGWANLNKNVEKISQ